MGKGKRVKLLHVIASFILVVQLGTPGLTLAAEDVKEELNQTNQSTNDVPSSNVEDLPSEENVPPMAKPEEESTPEMEEPQEQIPNEDEVVETEQPSEEVPNETEETDVAPDEADSEEASGKKDAPPETDESKQGDKRIKEEKAPVEKKELKKERSPSESAKKVPIDDELNSNEISEEEDQKSTSSLENEAKGNFPNQIDFVLPVSEVLTEAYLDNHVISSTNKHANLHVHLTENVKLKGIVWDALNPDGGPFGDGNLGGILGEESFYLNHQSYGPGDDQLLIGTQYCPFDWVQTPCAWDLAEGVYTIKLSATAEDMLIDGEIPIGPIFVKHSSATIDFAPISEPIENGFIRGDVSDKFIEWAPTIQEVYDEEYDVNEHIFATYQLVNEQNQKVEEDALILDQNGTFTIPLYGLKPGHYTATVKIEDAGENTPTEERITFEVGRSIPLVEPRESSEKHDQPSDPGANPDQPSEPGVDPDELDEPEKVQEIGFDDSINAAANQLINIKETLISVHFPEDLSEGATLTIDRSHDENAAGDVVEVGYDSSEDDVGSYLLTLEIDDEFIDQELAIYYVNENSGEWEYLGGEVDYSTDTISTKATHSSKYGVFVVDE